MYIEIINRVGLDPETEDDLIAKYESDERWRLIVYEPNKMVFESSIYYLSEPIYLSGL